MALHLPGNSAAEAGSTNLLPGRLALAERITSALALSSRLSLNLAASLGSAAAITNCIGRHLSLCSRQHGAASCARRRELASLEMSSILAQSLDRGFAALRPAGPALRAAVCNVGFRRAPSRRAGSKRRRAPLGASASRLTDEPLILDAVGFLALAWMAIAPRTILPVLRLMILGYGLGLIC